MDESKKREKIIGTLRKIVSDLERGYGGFLYLYDEFFKMGLIFEDDDIVELCHPDEHPECPKTYCYINGGECRMRAKED